MEVHGTELSHWHQVLDVSVPQQPRSWHHCWFIRGLYCRQPTSSWTLSRVDGWLHLSPCATGILAITLCDWNRKSRVDCLSTANLITIFNLCNWQFGCGSTLYWLFIKLYGYWKSLVKSVATAGLEGGVCVCWQLSKNNGGSWVILIKITANCNKERAKVLLY